MVVFEDLFVFGIMIVEVWVKSIVFFWGSVGEMIYIWYEFEVY